MGVIGDTMEVLKRESPLKLNDNPQNRAVMACDIVMVGIPVNGELKGNSVPLCSSLSFEIIICMHDDSLFVVLNINGTVFLCIFCV